jgi:hypothetical protein
MLGYGYGYNKILPRLTDGFRPTDLAGSQLYYAANKTNTLNAANFVAANNEFLSSASTDFQKGDEDFTIGCWVKFDSTTITQNVMGKFGNTSNMRSYMIYFNHLTNLIQFYGNNDGSAGGNTVAQISGIVAGNWYFVVGVHDSVNDLLKISLNGSAFATTSFSGGVLSTAYPFVIGKIESGANLDGAIDGAFFYDKALSLAEVQALYNSNNGISYESLTDDQKIDLVSWWEMNEESGTRFDENGTNNLTDNNTVGFTVGKIQELTEAGERVFRFIDQSPNGYDLTQNVATQQPIFGGVSVNFDGTNDIMFNSTVSPFIADTDGVIFFSFYNILGVTQRIISLSLATGTLTGRSTFALAKTTSNQIIFNLRNLSLTVQNDFTSDNSFPAGYNYGYLKRVVGGQELYMNGSLEPITYINNITPGSWLAGVGATNRISFGGIFTNSTVFYGQDQLNKVYYNNTALSPSDLTKLDTFFANPNNY